MLARIIPLITMLALIALFTFVVHVKRTRGYQYLYWNKKTSMFLGLTIITFHLAFTLYYVIAKGAYLYLLHTDLCTMLYPWVAACLFFNKRRMLAILMPLAITGGFFELGSQKMFFRSEAFNEVTSWIKNVALITIGIYILINEVNYKWKTFLYSVYWIIGFMFYIILVTGIPFWVTHDQRFGTFSMGIIITSYWAVNASFTGKDALVQEYGVLGGFGYPFGTIALLIVATLFSSSLALGAVLTSRYKIKKINSLIENTKRLVIRK